MTTYPIFADTETTKADAKSRRRNRTAEGGTIRVGMAMGQDEQGQTIRVLAIRNTEDRTHKEIMYGTERDDNLQEFWWGIAGL